MKDKNLTFSRFDIITDIHGSLDKLIGLLKKLGYQRDSKSYYHPDGRKILFLGDYIDRGDDQCEVFFIVRDIVNHDRGIALMGNHEFNAILYATKDGFGGHLREHSERNNTQHKAFLDQFVYESDLYYEAINFFKTLPFMFENDDFRALHACWDKKSIEVLKGYSNENYVFDEKLYFEYSSAGKKGELYESCENVLKGYEYVLPFYWKDGYGISRNTTRIKWFLDESTPLNLKNFSFHIKGFDMDEFNDVDFVFNFYDNEKPIFFGHYWMKGEPLIISPKICCLDYSAVIGGYLAAYRYNGEQELNNESIFYY